MTNLPPKYNSATSEAKWQQFWQDEQLYKYEKNSSKEPYTIDTPPPTVSGSLHIGHVFSYTQTEVIARYQRMLGKNVMYPFGFDDNGLPTEILTEKEHKIKAQDLTREEFIKKCEETSQKYRQEFKKLWQSLGFSCDWDKAYSTISKEAQRISQRSFLDLYKKNFVEYKDMPTLWCCNCKTSFAQAEVDVIQQEGIFNYFYFHSTNGDKIPIASTRPELLPSCVALFIHPENETYKHLIGQKAITPLFGDEVPILADENAAIDKGTGIVMCCTFGDVHDIDWWRSHNLECKLSFNKDGKLNERAKQFANLPILEGRAKIIQALKDEGFMFKQENIPANNRMVNVHERCGTPVEYLNTKQWFIKVIDFKKELIEQGKKVNWYPSYMEKRYQDWVQNLAWDWSISRQRFFGVPIPIWYTKDGKVLPACDEQLPVNPQVDMPLNLQGENPANLIGESDVLDTWATSSISPLLNAKWQEEDEDKTMLPMSMRPQAHDIIRTWAFYTIAKSYFHFNDIPWKDAVISGHVIKKQNKVNDQAQVLGKHQRKSKISKKDHDKQYSPINIIQEYGADAIRYWACSGTLGTDISFDDEEIKTVHKLLNKLWNSSRFIQPYLNDYNKVEPTDLIDMWILNKFNQVQDLYHHNFSKYEFFAARNELEKFFYNSFCDNYLEFCKDRLWNRKESNPKSYYSCIATLHHLLLAQLKLFAPFIPHICEELYQNLYQEQLEQKSINILKFSENFKIEDSQKATKAGQLFIELMSLIRGFKSQNNYSMKLAIKTLTIQASKDDQAIIQEFQQDLQALSKTSNVVFSSNEQELTSQNTSISIIMDEEALKRLALVQAIKQAVSSLKKEAQLKAKSPIDTVFVSSSEQELLAKEPKQILMACSAAKVEFVSDVVSYQHHCQINATLQVAIQL